MTTERTQRPRKSTTSGSKGTGKLELTAQPYFVKCIGQETMETDFKRVEADLDKLRTLKQTLGSERGRLVEDDRHAGRPKDRIASANVPQGRFDLRLRFEVARLELRLRLREFTAHWESLRDKLASNCSPWVYHGRSSDTMEPLDATKHSPTLHCTIENRAKMNVARSIQLLAKAQAEVTGYEEYLADRDMPAYPDAVKCAFERTEKTRSEGMSVSTLALVGFYVSQLIWLPAYIETTETEFQRSLGSQRDLRALLTAATEAENRLWNRLGTNTGNPDWALLMTMPESAEDLCNYEINRERTFELFEAVRAQLRIEVAARGRIQHFVSNMDDSENSTLVRHNVACIDNLLLKCAHRLQVFDNYKTVLAQRNDAVQRQYQAALRLLKSDLTTLRSSKRKPH